ncbi:MAG: glycosyltransferase family 39 protein [Myxococcota bacterium]|nr:glycosyltransferase family 39 protein [Myxococcota bacterium]
MSAPHGASRSFPRVGARELAIALGAATAWALVVRPGPLSLPYFWDEADVYAPGARWLAEHDLDPTPGHFPDDWSRGHPPLFYWIAALAFRVLGSGPAVGHAVIVPFTALALAATYALGAERAGRAVGLGAAALLATSPLFLSMGAFLLPEMPLTALTVLAIWMVSRGHVGVAAMLGVAMVWTKETGVFPALAIAGGLFVQAARAGELRRALRPIAISLLPLAALALFFVWQRANAGYFVFPHHQNLFSDRALAIENAWTVVPSTFLWHGRWVATLAGIAAAIVLSVRRAWPASLRADATNVALVLLVIGNAIFFAKSFWLERYALPAHPGVCVLIAVAIVSAASLAPRSARALLAGAPLVIASGLGMLSLRATGTTDAPEHTFAFADVALSHREAFARIAAAHAGALVVTTWPMTTELREPWLGFVPSPVRAIHPDHLGDHPDWTPDVVLVDASSTNAERLRTLAREHGMERRETIARGDAPELELWSR